MNLIAHRGNTTGPNPKKENTLSYIFEALNIGFHVEIDVWLIDNHWFLGHDAPDHEIDQNILKIPNLWCHAKNYEALYEMLKNDVHCFWHQEDDMTITSQNFIWTFPGKPLTAKSIAVMPETIMDINNIDFKCAGICSDFVRNIK